jgi:hypothetical protein
VALTPGIGWAFALIHDQRWHAKLLEARAESETYLPGGADRTIGLLSDAKFGAPGGPAPFASRAVPVRIAAARRWCGVRGSQAELRSDTAR